ncbi:Microtubule associated protein family protein [Perilla frutescens var. hirtella]|nr:Microtubule associated protein family protein [Perilla frutescens var. hirtella]
MPACQKKMLLRMESALGSLLHELQRIWDEVGESDDERDRVLLELEQECLEVYRRKVDQANRCRAQLRQEIADAEAELAAICSAMGERPVHIRQSDQNPENLKAELRMILPQIQELRKRKNDRKNKVFEVLIEIQSIKNEICSSNGLSSNETALDEVDLSIKKLEELHKELQALQKEKSKRLRMTLDGLNSLHSLCIVLGLDFKKIANKIHPSLGEVESSKNISNSTVEQLGNVIQQLRELKLQRMQQAYLTTSLLELWNLMDTPIEEQQIFQKVTCKLAASEDEIIEPDILSIDYINYVAAEVSRLEELKASKMKELVLKKKAELEAISRKTHLIPERDSEMEKGIHATIESGPVDAAIMLDQIELKIARAKEEALSRKEILEKVEKWMALCEEESWLEKYNRDDNRYTAGRGAHLTLKRAEKARALVNKLPAMVETLASKTIAWENEKGIEFFYDGVRLLTMLEGYKVLRKEKELQRKRQRDQKKHQGQLLTKQEALYGSKPSPIKNPSVKKAPRLSYGGASNRKVSLGAPVPQTCVTPSAKATPNMRIPKKNECINQDRRKDDRPAAFSSVRRRGLSMAGVKQHSSNLLNAREAELPMMRKPFSPIASATPSKPNAANIMEELHRKHDELRQKLLIINSTPPKMISTAGQENRTPQKTLTHSTPPMVFIPMQTAITPASIQTTTIVPALSSTKSVEDEIEYSFEERRAQFVLPRSPLMKVAQV